MVRRGEVVPLLLRYICEPPVDAFTQIVHGQWPSRAQGLDTQMTSYIPFHNTNHIKSYKYDKKGPYPHSVSTLLNQEEPAHMKMNIIAFDHLHAGRYKG